MIKSDLASLQVIRASFYFLKSQPYYVLFSSSTQMYPTISYVFLFIYLF